MGPKYITNLIMKAKLPQQVMKNSIIIPQKIGLIRQML